MLFFPFHFQLNRGEFGFIIYLYQLHFVLDLLKVFGALVLFGENKKL